MPVQDKQESKPSCAVQDGIEQGWFRKPQTKKILEGGPDVTNILVTAREIAAALAYLHTSDVLHGDLTGNNILLASSHKDRRAFTVKVQGLQSMFLRLRKHHIGLTGVLPMLHALLE